MTTTLVPDAGTVETEPAFIPVQTRSERAHSFDPADFERPTGREVNWRHTPLDALAPLFDVDAPAGDLDVTVTRGAAAALRIGDAPRGSVFRPEDLPSALAWVRALEADHVVLDGEDAEPVFIEITGRGGIAHAHLVIEARANAHATVVLRHRGNTTLAQNVEIIVGDGAHLELVTVQEWNGGSVHAASHQARVGRDATLRHVVVSFGGAVVRVNPSIELAGTGARAEMYGLSYSDSGQHLESQVYLHHKGADTTGDVLYKGALQGAGARSVWIGDVLIGPDAVGTDSYEANRNLVLTEGARAESIPNLEIETGDIRGAGHASATGRFDDEQLFYLQARGIPEPEARRLVVLGFLSEIVQRIGVPSLEEELTELIERELAHGIAASTAAATGDSE